MKFFLLLPLLYIISVANKIEEDDEFCQYEEGCEEESKMLSTDDAEYDELMNDDFADYDISSFMEMDEDLDEANLMATNAIGVAYDAKNPELYGFPSEFGFIETTIGDANYAATGGYTPNEPQDANLLATGATAEYYNGEFLTPDDPNLEATGAVELAFDANEVPAHANLLATGAVEVVYNGGFVSEDANQEATGGFFPHNLTKKANYSATGGFFPNIVTKNQTKNQTKKW